MATIKKSRGPIRGFTVAVGAYSRGGAYRQFVVLGWGLIREGGGLFEGEGQFEDSRYFKLFRCFA